MAHFELYEQAFEEYKKTKEILHPINETKNIEEESWSDSSLMIYVKNLYHTVRI